MKCPNCGAETGNSNFCEFCGSQISTEMQKEKEQLNKKTCPNCGSTNIEYKRENQGEIKSDTNKEIIHRTVAVCKDCGNTWFSDDREPVKKRKTWLWVLGWIFIFPLPLTLILIKKKDMKPALKYGIIAAAWVLYLIFAFAGNAGSSDNSNTPSAEPTSSVTTVEKNTPEKSESTEEETEALTTKAETTTKKIETTKSNISIGKLNALRSAESYLRYSAFSYKGLIEQLEFENYSNEEAKYAADNCGADWNEQAAKSAKSYLEYSSFSRQGLIEQLEFEGFTHEQAVYGAEAVGY